MKRRCLKGMIQAILLFTFSFVFAGDKLEVGSKAPDFSLPVALSDSTISLADLTGKKAVILHFWKSH